MKTSAPKLSLVAIALLLVGVACTPANKSSGEQTKKAELTKIDGLSRYALAEPISYGNVTLVPIVDVSKDAKTQPQTDFMSLSEAKAKGLIEIQEVPEGAQVDTLIVKNLGKKPILLLAGELLLGGQQDRIVAKDTVVPPGATVKVPAFCVEPNRWEGPTKTFDSDGAMVPQSVRKSATFEDQGAVWAKVGKYNSNVVTLSGQAARGSSVRGGLKNEEVQARIIGDLPKFIKDLNGAGNVVGFVYVLNGEVQTAELFGDHKLFDAGRDGLLKGFLADAAIVKPDPKAKVSVADCATFLKDVMAGKRDQTALRAGNADFTLSGTNAMGMESRMPAGAGGGAASPKDDSSGFLHGTYSKKKD